MDLLHGWAIGNVFAIIGVSWFGFNLLKFTIQLLTIVNEYNNVNRLYHTDHNRIGVIEYEIKKLKGEIK